MREVSGDTAIAWESGVYVGTNRPMARVTIQDLNMLIVPVDHSFVTPFAGVDTTPGGGDHAASTNSSQKYASAMFGQLAQPVELPNVKSVKWSRNVSTDAATCTVELYNTEPLPLGTTPENSEDFERIGWFTVDRGQTTYSSRWGYGGNGWAGRIAPDKIMRTYEGYGFNKTLTPEDDPHMYASGVWLIDSVQYQANGIITVTARDLVRILIDQIAFPPVVPLEQYPLRFLPKPNLVDDPPVPVTSGSWKQLKYESDSGIPYLGANAVNHGHAPSDALDTSAATYWLSIGNGSPNKGFSFEYVQGTTGTPQNLTALKFQVWGGPYRCYVSVKSNGNWAGSQIVPYDPHNPVSAPNGSNIPYVASFTVGFEQTVQMPLVYKNVTSVRLTFTDLFNSGIGPFKYRAGVRTISVNTASTVMTVLGQHDTGNFDDYTDIVKILLAYGGFYWPNNASLAVNRATDGDVTSTPSGSNDAVLGTGRIWGDLEQTGTNSVTLLDVPIWDKKPLMDGISYIRDIVAFVFFVDETGGAVWRSPNIWQIGNYVGDTAADASFIAGMSHVLQIDEELTLMDISVTTSSQDVRENIFVANSFGKLGATAAGFNPYPSGLRRVSGWTDQNFQSVDQCQIMADLIALRQLFQYRTDKIVIPGYPAFQIDDQVQLYERVTNEGYIHYISGIDSSFDMETGEWSYTLSTHWLGVTPFSDWTFNPADLSQATRDYLTAIGKITA